MDFLDCWQSSWSAHCSLFLSIQSCHLHYIPYYRKESESPDFPEAFPSSQMVPGYEEDYIILSSRSPSPTHSERYATAYALYWHTETNSLSHFYDHNITSV